MMSHATRLAALRAELSSLDVDGFLLPRGDEHLGEYVPDSAARLAWLTGFTGSAGCALILPDRAMIFSDGRYQLQLAQQIDPALWQYGHLYETPPQTWLARHGGLARIGYDPRIISEVELRPFIAAGCLMIPLGRNPVDAIWRDRPAVPASQVTLQPDRWTGRSAEDKVAALAAKLRDEGQDAVILPDPGCIAWLLNIRGSDLAYLPVALCFAILHAEGSVDLFIDPGRLADPVRAHLRATTQIHTPDALQGALIALDRKTIRIDQARCPVWFAQTLRAAGATIVDGVDPCLLPRACKTAAEREGMREAHLLDGIALTRFLCWFEKNGIGRSETDLAGRLLAFRLEADSCLGASFDSIACAGPNAAIMHYMPQRGEDAVIGRDMFFLIDSGGQYRSGTTDVTRTIWTGDRPPVSWCNQYTRVLKGLISLSRAVFPEATPGYRLDPLARHALWEAGLDFDHGAGHGLGSYLSVHEWPLGFTRRPVLDPVHEHMVLTNEPGYYAPGSHGMRLENAMLATLDTIGEAGRYLRFETLTLAPIDRRGIDVTLLTPTEIDWLDHYHARVFQMLSPYLDDNERAWLDQVCQPL